ncbi:glycosyltransferase family 2 protein [Maridesulfovibrio zosterae]|uniref:glycosyltransferase family 2 protein n=1 Tax=Maridesulfovibrio zosterae TaxID=82171 RepID=UPI00042048A5|nr:glycosyltransferase family A protein [Maridesulfovibrio zosterae]
MCLLSIVIPNYNYGRFAGRFFSSIADQSMSLDDVEIIFVDDGSTDDSILQAQKWAQKLACKNFNVYSPSRSGNPGLVRNYGLEKAQGEFLVCLDPDDSIHPDYFAVCIDCLQYNSLISIVYTDYLERRSDIVTEYLLPEFKPIYLRTQNPVPPAAVFRRSIWDSGVRYRANTTYEDWDFWIQCQMTGAKFKHIAQILYNYEIHNANFSQQAVKDDGSAKAQIVLNNPSFFNPAVNQWAVDHIRGRLYAPAFRRGYIPTSEDINAVTGIIRGDN